MKDQLETFQPAEYLSLLAIEEPSKLATRLSHRPLAPPSNSIPKIQIVTA